MNDLAFWFCWYAFFAFYTAAITTARPRDVNHVRAAVLWPVFWGVIIWRRWWRA